MEIRTRYGTLRSCFDEEYYGDGTLKSCNFNEENRLKTGCGVLVPHYGPENVRSKYGKAVGFYPNGVIRRIALERMTGVQSPIGEFPAELVTFYEDEAICRIFPLNGRLTGFWTEEDEEKTAAPLHFSFSFGEFSSKIISVHFYESGGIQSVTLFPKERISLQTRFGKITVRTGFSLYEDGALQSLEPAEPTAVSTPVGILHAYDSNPAGITADRNSLWLDPDGNAAWLSTVTDKIVVQTPDARLDVIEPMQAGDPLNDQATVILPVKVEFTAGTARFTCKETRSYSLAGCGFSVLPIPYVASPAECAGCSGCGGVCPIKYSG